MVKNDDYIIQKLAGVGLKPLKPARRQKKKKIVFYQEPYYLNNDRFVNLYWVEIERRDAKFALLSFLKKKPLRKIVQEFYQRHHKTPLVAINTSNFYLSDYGREPKVYSFNLFFDRGKIIQFPSNDRSTVIE